MSFFQHGLRRSVAQLSRSSLPRSQAVCWQQKLALSQKPLSDIVKLATAARYYTTPTKPARAAAPTATIPLPTASRSKDSSQQQGQRAGEDSGAKQSSWPESNPKVVAYWLLGSAASCFGIVVFGGLTRLTESGYVF